MAKTQPLTTSPTDTLPFHQLSLRDVEPLLARLGDKGREMQVRAYKALTTVLNRHTPEPEVEEATFEPQTVPGPWNSRSFSNTTVESI